MTVLEDAERVLGRINAPNQADRPGPIEIVGVLAHLVEEHVGVQREWAHRGTRLRAVANERDEWQARAERAEAKIAVAQEARTTNRLLVALIDQMSAIAEAMPDLKHVRPGARIGIRSYLPQSDWDRLEVDV